MIFRAIFWIGFVALLMPREPDLGLGRPGAGTLPSTLMTGMASSGLSRHEPVCDGQARACAGGLTLLYAFQDKAMRGLATVKADIDANRKPWPARLL